jgi:hypothetical protein
MTALTVLAIAAAALATMAGSSEAAGNRQGASNETAPANGSGYPRALPAFTRGIGPNTTLNIRIAPSGGRGGPAPRLRAVTVGTP